MKTEIRSFPEKASLQMIIELDHYDLVSHAVVNKIIDRVSAEAYAIVKKDILPKVLEQLTPERILGAAIERIVKEAK